jgi:branched-chain amino acid transport system substrate-binding protein
MQKIIIAAAQGLNAAGGAGGRKFEVFAEDDQTQPEPAVLAAKKLAEINGVQAIIGTWSSGSTLAVMNAVTQPDSLLHMHVSGAEEIANHAKDLVFGFSAAARNWGIVYAKIAGELGLSKPAILQFNNGSAAAQTAGFVETWRAMGRKAPAPVIYEPNRATYRSELQLALRDSPDFVVFPSYEADALIILREWYQTGIPTKFLMPSFALEQKSIDQLGKDVTQGIEIVSSMVEEGSPTFAEYDGVYRKATGQPGNSNKYGAMCWDMMNVLALAMEVAGPSASPLEIAGKFRQVANPPGTIVSGFAQGREALKAGKIKYEGASSKLSFDEHGSNSGSIFAWQTVEQGIIKTHSLVSTL